MTPEGKVKAKVKKRLEAEFDKKCWRFMPVQNGMGSPGLDFFLCFYGFFVAIETKVPGKWLTDRQEQTVREIQAAEGHCYVVWDDASLEDCIICLRSLLRTEQS